MDLYLLYKILHIFFVISWFAGIFYLPRLFVNHVEVESIEVKKHLSIMEKRLIKFITPLGLLAIIFGFMMSLTSPNLASFLNQKWIITKIIVTLSLIGYQVWCWKIIKDLSTDNSTWTGFQLRIFNEVPVIFLLSGIIAAIYKF